MSPIADNGEAICSIERWTVSWPELGDRQEVDQLVDDLLSDLVVLEHEPEDRDERDGQREEGKQHAIRNGRCVLGAAVGEHVLDSAAEARAARPGRRRLRGRPASARAARPVRAGSAAPSLIALSVRSTVRYDRSRTSPRSSRSSPSRRYDRTGSRFPFTAIGGTGSTVAREPSARNVSSPISTDPTGPPPGAAPRGSRRLRRCRACDARARPRRRRRCTSPLDTPTRNRGQSG